VNLTPTGTQQPLIEAWDGSGWSIQSTLDVIPGALLNGVACAHSSVCVSVGVNSLEGGQTTSFAEIGGAPGWAASTPGVPSGSYLSPLAGIACPSATRCIAVGQRGYATRPVDLLLAEIWNGTHWTIRNPPNPSGGFDNELNGISCISTTSCIAVGSTFGIGYMLPLAERYSPVS
jgi:hypothetical protein